MLIVTVVWFVQSLADIKSFYTGCKQSRAVILKVHTLANEHTSSCSECILPTSARTYRQTTFTHLSSFARNSNQQREHWKPIRCSLLHIGLFDFAFSKQTICPTIAMNITKEQECWFGVSSSQEARDVTATIMYSLKLTAANGRGDKQMTINRVVWGREWGGGKFEW